MLCASIHTNLLITHQALVLLTHLRFTSSNSSSIELYRCKEDQWVLKRGTQLQMPATILVTLVPGGSETLGRTGR